MHQPQLCHDVQQLYEFLLQLDPRMPTPLHEIVDIGEYAEKVLRLGHAAVIEQDGRIVCAACFYCNDTQTKSAYLSVLGTLSGHESKGYAAACLALAERVSAEHGMAFLRLDAVAANTRAVRFYHYHGYRTEHADQKLHLVKELSV